MSLVEHVLSFGIIDVSNVARVGRVGKLNRLIMVTDELRRIGMDFILIADASLRHCIDDKETYEKMLENGTIIQAPAGSDADIYMLKVAEQNANKRSVIVSNDYKLGKSKLFAHNIKYMFYPLDDK